MKILYVEDDYRVRPSIAELLKDHGHHVMTAGTCDAAMGMIASTNVAADLLLTDVETPGRMCGWELAHHARRLLPAIAVIYGTACDGGQHRAVSGGVILPKPFTAASLLMTVQLLGHRHEPVVTSTAARASAASRNVHW